MKNQNLTALRSNRDDLIQELELAGAVFRGEKFVCPFHEDHNPSASVKEAPDGSWHFICFACGAKGDIFDARARRTGRDVKDVLREAAGTPERRPRTTQSGEPPLPAEPPDYEDANHEESHLHTPPPAARPVRVLTDLTEVRATKVNGRPLSHLYRYTNPATGLDDMLVARYDGPDGKDFRQMSPVEGGWTMKAPAKPWPLYNRRGAALHGGTVLVVEGEKCVHALADIRVPAVTSPGGSSNAKNADWSPLAGRSVVIWPDGDAPGRKYAAEVIAILGQLDPPAEVALLDVVGLGLSDGEDGLDAADALAETPGSAEDKRTLVLDMLTCAERLGPIGDLRRQMENTISGSIRAVAFPWPMLTRFSRALLPGSILLFCGSAGATKSLMLLQALAHWVEQGEKVAVFELEEDRTFHLNRALAQDQNNSKLTDDEWIRAHPEETRAAMRSMTDTLRRLGSAMWTSDATTEATLDAMAQWVEARAQAGCRVIVIDPITLAGPGQDREWDAARKFMFNAKRAVVAAGASLILVTHPKKGAPTATGKRAAPFTLDDLAGGAAYARLCSAAFHLEALDVATVQVRLPDGGSLTRPHNRIVRILKSRNGIGQGAKIAFYFDAATLKAREEGPICSR